MRKAKKSATQERLAKERAEQRAKTAKLKAARLAAAAKKTDELEQSAKRVAALYKSMREFEAHAEEKAGFELKKAAEKRAALEKALTEARELCKAAGQSFKAFHKKYAPDYKRTQLYQILAIADGRITTEDVREGARERKRRQRAGESVRDKSDVTDKAAEAPAEPTAPVTEAKQAKPAKTTGKPEPRGAKALQSAKPAPVEDEASEPVARLLTPEELKTGKEKVATCWASLAVLAEAFAPCGLKVFDPEIVIAALGAEAAEAFARAILAKLGVDAPDASSARSEASKGKALKPGDALIWDDFAEDKNDGGYRRGIAEPIPGKLNYLVEPDYDDDGKAVGQQVVRRTYQGKAEATKLLACPGSYAECKIVAQTDFDAGGK